MEKQKKEFNINQKHAKQVSSLTSGKFGIYSIWILWIIVLGIVALTLSTIWDRNTTILLSSDEINGIKFWKVDLWRYLTNLSISLNPNNLKLDIPTLNQSNIITTTISMINYIIMLINVLTYPLRINGFITLNLMAIVGINMNTDVGHSLTWAIDLAEFFTKLQIPYIPNP